MFGGEQKEKTNLTSARVRGTCGVRTSRKSDDRHNNGLGDSWRKQLCKANTQHLYTNVAVVAYNVTGYRLSQG